MGKEDRADSGKPIGNTWGWSDEQELVDLSGIQSRRGTRVKLMRTKVDCKMLRANPVWYAPPERSLTQNVAYC